MRSARSLYLPAKPASALDETLPLVQALVGIALEMASEDDGGGGGSASSTSHLRVIPGSVEAELEKQKEVQRLMSLYKLFPAMLDVVAVEGFKPDRISDISALTEMAIQRFTQDMDHAIALLTEPHAASTSTPASGASSPSSTSSSLPRVVVGSGDDAGGGVSTQPCNPRGFHTECWQFLTILSRLLLFDSVDVIAPAATSHLPTALILFIGKLQGKLSERRAGVSASASTSLPFALPVVTALDIPSIRLHPYTTASTTFEQLHSQVFGMLYIMCKHESALYDVMYGGHLRTLFSVFINAPVCEAAFHDEAPDSSAPAIWAVEGQRLTSQLHFLSTSSFRAGVMMVMNGVMKEHPQDGLDYMQVHDLISMLLNAIAAPYPPPRPAASQEPDPALEVVVDCVRLLMLVLRTAVKHAPTTTYYPPQLSQKTIASVAAQTQPASSFTSPPAALPYTSPPPTPQSSSLATTQPLPGSSTLPPPAAMATGGARPLHTSASANSVASSLSVPPDLFTPLPQATCPLLEEFELSNGYDVLRDFLLTHLKDYEVVVDQKDKEEERKREEEERLARQRRRSRSGSATGGGDGGRRRKSYVQRKASKQSMVDDFLQQMRELAFIGFRPLKPTAEQYLSTQQPLSFARQTVRANFNPSHTLKRSRSQLGLGHRQSSHPGGRHAVGSEEESKGGRRSDRLEQRNYYSVDVMYDALQRYEALHSAHIPSLAIPAPPQASHPHHHHIPARPFTIHSSSISLAYIANFAAFDSLFHLVQHSTSSYIRLMALLHLQSIVASHPYNYLTLKDQHRVNLFNYLLHLLNDAACSEQLKDVASHVLGFLVSFEYYTPYAELLALVHSFQPSEGGEGKGVVAALKARKKVEEGMEAEEEESDGLASESFSSPAVVPLSVVSADAAVYIGRVLTRLMLCDRVYQQNVLRDLGLLRISLDRVHSYEKLLDIQERGSASRMTSDQAEEQRRNAQSHRLTPVQHRLLDTAMDVLHALLHHNFEHQQLFKADSKGYALMTRLLLSEVTRRRAIRHMEALVELELKSVHLKSFSPDATAATSAAKPDRAKESLREGLEAMRRDSKPPLPHPHSYANDTSLSSTPVSTPPISRSHSRQVSASSASEASKESSRHGVQAYIALLLDLIHELPTWNYEGKGLFMRSLRWLLHHSRKAQEFFRLRSGFFNLFLLLDKVKVPELQRRKALRRRQDTGKPGAELQQLRGSVGGNELEDMRAKEEARLDSLLLYVRSIFLTLTAAMRGSQASRAQMTRFGYERIMDSLYQTEVFGHKSGVECIAVWFLWLCTEYSQGTSDGAEEDFDATAPLHPPNALSPAHLMLPTPAQTLVPLFSCATLSLIVKSSLDFQLTVLTYLYVLARDDVGNRSALGRVGFLSHLLDLYRPTLLSPPDTLSAEKKELRSTLLLFIRVLTSFTSSTVDVNSLFAFLEEKAWEHMIDPLTDMTDHSNQNGRLWPYVYFDLSRRSFDRPADRRRDPTASIAVDSVKTSAGVWPPRDGYTFSGWIHIDQFSVEDEQRLLLPSPISAAVESQTSAASAPSSTSSTITLLEVESEDRKSFLRLFIRNRQLYLQPSRAALHHFSAFTFEPRAWYHVAVTHTSGGLLGASKASLFVNGALVQALRASYVEPSLTPNNPVHAHIGHPGSQGERGSRAGSRSGALSPARKLERDMLREAHDDEEADGNAADDSDSDDDDEDDDELEALTPHSSTVHMTALRLKQPRRLVPFSLSTMSSILNFTNVGGIQWRLAQCQLTEVPISDDRIPALYYSNPRDSGAAGDLVPGRMAAKDTRKRFELMAYETYHSESRLRGYLAAQLQPPKVAGVTDAAVVSAPPRPRPHPSSVLPLDKLLIFYHAQNYFNSPQHRATLLVNFGQDQSEPRPHVPPHPRPLTRLPLLRLTSVAASAPRLCRFHPQVSHGEIRGDCHLYRPRGLPDSIHKVGGLKRILVLLARCGSSELLLKVLVLLNLMLADSAKNHEDLDDLGGYKLIAFILKVSTTPLRPPTCVQHTVPLPSRLVSSPPYLCSCDVSSTAFRC